MNDRIEIAFVFDTLPSIERLAEYFEETVATGEGDIPEEFDVTYWDESGRTHDMTGSSRDVADVCLTQSSAMVTIQFGGFELEIGPNHDREPVADVPHLLFSEHVHPFEADWDGPSDTVRERRWRLANVLADSASILDPKWGFGRRDGLAIPEGTSTERLADSSHPPLYEYNVFDADVVDAIGRERIHSSPAWFSSELETGGAVLIPREPPQSCTPVEAPCTAVAEHLGLSVARVD